MFSMPFQSEMLDARLGIGAAFATGEFIKLSVTTFTVPYHHKRSFYGACLTTVPIFGATTFQISQPNLMITIGRAAGMFVLAVDILALVSSCIRSVTVDPLWGESATAPCCRYQRPTMLECFIYRQKWQILIHFYAPLLGSFTFQTSATTAGAA